MKMSTRLATDCIYKGIGLHYLTQYTSARLYNNRHSFGAYSVLVGLCDWVGSEEYLLANILCHITHGMIYTWNNWIVLGMYVIQLHNIFAQHPNIHTFTINGCLFLTIQKHTSTRPDSWRIYRLVSILCYLKYTSLVRDFFQLRLTVKQLSNLSLVFETILIFHYPYYVPE